MSGSSQRRTVLITGATGALGNAVVRLFEEDSWEIRTLSRTTPATATAAAAHPHVAADIRDVEALCRATDGVDAIVHMAALLHVVGRPGELNAEYRRVNIDGTSAVAAAAVRRGVSRLVLLSSIAVYGLSHRSAPDEGGTHVAMVDEDTVPRPDTPYAASKLAAERVALAVNAPDGKPLTTVLRLAAVYGPSVKGNYERLVHALARRRFVPIGRGHNARTLVFEEDAARAIVLAASHRSARGGIFNVTDGEIHTVDEIVSAIARALGRRPPRFHVPAGPTLFGAGLLETLAGVAGRRPPVTRETLKKYLENVAVSGRRIRDALGFSPRWTLDDGWRHTIQTLRRQGRL